MKVARPSFITIFMCLVGCNSPTDFDVQLHDIASREKAIDCDLQDLRDSVGIEWERVTSMMRDKLPVSMPMLEKNNMLQAKNANLIRMFESYETLDDDVKMAVDKAERKDASIATQVMQFRKERQKIEVERMEVFGLVRRESVRDIERLRQVYDQVLKSDCD